MDFNDTAEEAEFRAEVRGWLRDNAPRKSRPGDIFSVKYGAEDLVPVAKDWQARKAKAGFAGITWPKEYGGRAARPIYQVIYNQEESHHLVPRGVFDIGLGMCMPTMMTYATEEQKRRYVPKALRGEEIWCQMFSEPAAGSDVAGVETRVVRDGEHWIVNGQKIWTSGAHFADFGVLLVRSDPTVPKHKGLSYFFIDMKSPGIEVRRIKQISGTSHFNHVFFTDVRVPDAQRLGAVGDGWRVALTTLMNERLAVGDRPSPDFEEIFGLARELQLESGPAIANPMVREKLADWYVQTQGLKYTRFRAMTALSRGETPGPELSIGKVVSATKRQEIAAFGMDLLDMGGVIADPGLAPMEALFQEALLSSPGGRIAGGTDEILRNIIAERVLGLPPDIRVDKALPFEQLPRKQK